MHRFIPKKDAALRQIAPNKTALNYVTKDMSGALSFAVTEGTNFSETEVCEYDRVYFVLEGELTLEADGETSLLRSEDACFIGRGTEYVMSGTFRAVVANSPAFGSADQAPKH
jgi:ethanolamine utilization protein EutQ (cupin superfamily)